MPRLSRLMYTESNYWISIVVDVALRDGRTDRSAVAIRSGADNSARAQTDKHLARIRADLERERENSIRASYSLPDLFASILRVIPDTRTTSSTSVICHASWFESTGVLDTSRSAIVSRLLLKRQTRVKCGSKSHFWEMRMIGGETPRSHKSAIQYTNIYITKIDILLFANYPRWRSLDDNFFLVLCHDRSCVRDADRSRFRDGDVPDERSREFHTSREIRRNLEARERYILYNIIRVRCSIV